MSNVTLEGRCEKVEAKDRKREKERERERGAEKEGCKGSVGVGEGGSQVKGIKNNREESRMNTKITSKRFEVLAHFLSIACIHAAASCLANQMIHSAQQN